MNGPFQLTSTILTCLVMKCILLNSSASTLSSTTTRVSRSAMLMSGLRGLGVGGFRTPSQLSETQISSRIRRTPISQSQSEFATYEISHTAVDGGGLGARDQGQGQRNLGDWWDYKCNYTRRNMSETNNNNNLRKGPGLIVFDLDYTMWPYHVDTTVSLPFSMKNSTIVDRSGQVIQPFPEAVEVLEYLVAQGYTLAAASRTKMPPDAQQLLEYLDWNKYFTYKEIYPGCKVTHFERFMEQSKLPYSSMLFFDDEQRNIRDVSTLGVKCIFVPNGVNMTLVKEAIGLFEDRKL